MNRNDVPTAELYQRNRAAAVASEPQWPWPLHHSLDDPHAGKTRDTRQKRPIQNLSARNDSPYAANVPPAHSADRRTFDEGRLRTI